MDAMYKMSISKPADVVLVTAGGLPKDMNLYQAQKALDNAAWAVKPGGVIILVASCREGFGEEKWIMEAYTPEDIVERLKKGFVLGAHKAAAIARVLQIAEVWLVSQLPKKVLGQAAAAVVNRC